MIHDECYSCDFFYCFAFLPLFSRSLLPATMSDNHLQVLRVLGLMYHYVGRTLVDASQASCERDAVQQACVMSSLSTLYTSADVTRKRSKQQLRFGSFYSTTRRYNGCNSRMIIQWP
jgi:hypothetical protein